MRGAQAMGLLDGTNPAPEKTLEAEESEKKKIMIPNPAYGAWNVRDQQLVSYLVKSSRLICFARSLAWSMLPTSWLPLLQNSWPRSRFGSARSLLPSSTPKKRSLCHRLHQQEERVCLRISFCGATCSR
jgi:hypothetical protein